MTFDGQDYNIQENCTYILVQEITPKNNNFKVVIDYHDCGSDESFCPQTLKIYYKSYEVVITQKSTANGIVNAVISLHCFIHFPMFIQSITEHVYNDI